MDSVWSYFVIRFNRYTKSIVRHTHKVAKKNGCVIRASYMVSLYTFLDQDSRITKVENSVYEIYEHTKLASQ